MEERLQLSDDTKNELPPPPGATRNELPLPPGAVRNDLPPPPGAIRNELPPLPGATSLETYVVQIPRDQVYRVPPPERALYIEEHQRRKSSNKDANKWRSLWPYAIAAAVFALITLITVLTVRATVYRPITPQFAVAYIEGKNLENHLHGKQSPEFKITIQASNPNTRMSVSYKEGGEATLNFKNKKIGQGKIPSTIKEGNNVDFAVELNGEPLSKEIEKSLNDEKEKSMELTIESLSVEMNSWLRNEQMDMKISCDFRVSNSLMNKAKISFQQCKTKI